MEKPIVVIEQVENGFILTCGSKEYIATTIYDIRNVLEQIYPEAKAI